MYLLLKKYDFYISRDYPTYQPRQQHPSTVCMCTPPTSNATIMHKRNLKGNSSNIVRTHQYSLLDPIMFKMR